jgi:hypothetical protein
MTQARREESMVAGFDQAGLELDASEIFDALPAATSGATQMRMTEQSLAEMFRDFDSGGSGRPDEADYGTRFDLGRAFREVGLLDEAIAEFTLAAADESRVPQCSSLIGLCYMEKEMPDVAVTWFDKSLAALGWCE